MKIRENLDIKWFGGFASRGGWYLVVISYVGFGGSTSIVGGWLVVEGYMGLDGSPWWQYRAWRNQVGSFDSPQQRVLRLKGLKSKIKFVIFFFIFYPI